MNTETKLEQARDRILRQAALMVPLFDDLAVAGTFVGVGAALLMKTRGPEFAARYLYEIAGEIAQADDGPIPDEH